MLDQFLEVAYAREKNISESVKLAHLLKDLPVEDLKKLASGEAKLSFGPSGEEWIDKYKGTPLFDQAITLEKADIEAEVARTQAMANAPPWDMMNKTQDQIRVQKRMLDLELFQLQNGQATGPMQPMDLVSASAQGAGAPGDAGPAEMPEKAASFSVRVNQLSVAEKFEKAAFDIGALKEVGKKGLEWAAKHPTRAGALAGAGVGAVGGALAGGEGHRLSGALGGATLGAGLGHAAGGVGAKLQGGAALGDALKAYGHDLAPSSEVTPSMVMTDRSPPPLPKKPQAPLPYQGPPPEVTDSMILTDRSPPRLPKKPKAPLTLRLPREEVPMTLRSPEVKAAAAARFALRGLLG